MMQLIRKVLGVVILFLDRTFKPALPNHVPQVQARLDELCRGLVIYQFEACPFCVKVRRALKRMGLRIEIRNAERGTTYSAELEVGGGQFQVPCLRVCKTGQTDQWIYESDDIIQYLEKNVLSAAHQPS